MKTRSILVPFFVFPSASAFHALEDVVEDIVTKVAQVASQTLAKLAIIDRVTDKLVLRPRRVLKT